MVKHVTDTNQAKPAADIRTRLLRGAAALRALGIVLIIGLLVAAVWTLALGDWQVSRGGNYDLRLTISAFALGVLGIILAIALFVLGGLVRHAAQATHEHLVTAATTAPAWDALSRPVIEIEGIGPAFAERLEQADIRTIGDLLNADANGVSEKIQTRPATIERWQSMADLLRVPSVGPQAAEALVGVGVGSVRELAQAEPSQLRKHLGRVNRGRSPIDLFEVERWIDGARLITPRGAQIATTRPGTAEAAKAAP